MRALWMAFRHLLAILLLPFMVVIVIPRWLRQAWRISDTQWPPGSSLAVLGEIAGAVIFLAGFALFAWCVSLFARIGKGTLAPWDPTQNLVVRGPYRHVRNPMITAVVVMLIGHALFHGSRVLAIWTATFVLLNFAFFIVFEEPDLERRFGEDYRRYKTAVPRWIPRRTPWNV